MAAPGPLVLGIESSCDETAAAVVRGGREVLSSVVYSQIAEHAVWGGVVPEIAGRSHLDKIVPAIDEALRQAAVGRVQLDAVAVTARPGLLGSLLVGVTAAKSLAWAWDKPLVDVHHIEAHIYAALMSLEQWVFPYVTLVVSGGHTSLYRTDSPMEHELLGATLDDAAGEALDKGAAMLGLEYPGGPSIERAAAGGDPAAYAFKQPMLKGDSLDFSFSGMKTALLYKLKGAGGRREDETLPESRDLAGMAASFEHALVETLARKCLRACEQHGIGRVLVGGGVGRNKRLRARLRERAEKAGVEVAFAKPEHCTDNAVMIAGLGCARYAAGHRASLDLDVAAR